MSPRIPIEQGPARRATTPLPTPAAGGANLLTSKPLLDAAQTTLKGAQDIASVGLRLRLAEDRQEANTRGFQFDIELRQAEQDALENSSSADEFVEEYNYRKQELAQKFRDESPSRAVSRFLEPRMERVSALSDLRRDQMERGLRIDSARAGLVEQEASAIKLFAMAATPSERREIQGSFFAALDDAADDGVYKREDVAKIKVSFVRNAQAAFDKAFIDDYVDRNANQLMASGLSDLKKFEAIEQLPGNAEQKEKLHEELRSRVDQRLQLELVRAFDRGAELAARIDADPTSVTRQDIIEDPILAGTAQQTQLLTRLNDRLKGASPQKIDDDSEYFTLRRLAEQSPEKFVKLDLFQHALDEKIGRETLDDLVALQKDILKKGQIDTLNAEGWTLAKTKFDDLEISAEKEGQFRREYERIYTTRARKIQQDGGTVTEQLARDVRDELLDVIVVEENTFWPDTTAYGFEMTPERVLKIIDEGDPEDWPSRLQAQVIEQIAEDLDISVTRAAEEAVRNPASARRAAHKVYERGETFRSGG